MGLFICLFVCFPPVLGGTSFFFVVRYLPFICKWRCSMWPKKPQPMEKKKTTPTSNQQNTLQKTNPPAPPKKPQKTPPNLHKLTKTPTFVFQSLSLIQFLFPKRGSLTWYVGLSDTFRNSCHVSLFKRSSSSHSEKISGTPGIYAKLQRLDAWINSILHLQNFLHPLVYAPVLLHSYNISLKSCPTNLKIQRLDEY